MKFDIQPYVGVGYIKFGMTPDEIKNVMGEKLSSFKRSKEDFFETEEFNFMGRDFFITYDKEKKLDSIEFSLPSEVYLFGNNLYGKKFSEIRHLLESIDSGIDDDGYSITSYKFGIGVYCPEADEGDDVFPESLIVFKKGYYNA